MPPCCGSRWSGSSRQWMRRAPAGPAPTGRLRHGPVPGFTSMRAIRAIWIWAFYLVQGLAPRGLTSELDRELNHRLLAALQPCEDALQALGLDEATARIEHTALFAHGIGLLLLQHTGRIRLFGQDAEPLFQRYLQQLLLRLDPQGEAARAESPFEAAAPGSQPDLFGP
jgi:hypothetical protein